MRKIYYYNAEKILKHKGNDVSKSGKILKPQTLKNLIILN